MGGTSEDSGLSADQIFERNKRYVRRGSTAFETKLTPAEEAQFRVWVKKNKVAFDLNQTDPQDYDMRGFWKGMKDGDPKAANAVDPNDGKLHYPDYWKTPYDLTFSRQSQWATPDAPDWNDQDQLVDTDGNVVYDDRAVKKFADGGLVNDDSNKFVDINDLITSEGNAGTPFGQPEHDTSQDSPTWGDYGSAALSGAQSLGAQGDALGRYISELMGDTTAAQGFGGAEGTANMNAADTTAGMSDAGRKRLEASVTSGDFWSHPISAGLLKSVNMTPAMAAAILPGALTGGLASAALAGGGLAAGQMVDQFYQKIDAIPDADLQAQSDVYRGLRSMMPEADARREYDQQLLGLKPALNALVGAAAGVVGPAGTIARGGVAGAAERGLAGRIGVGAAEAGPIMGVQGGVADATVQSALMQGGQQKEFDPSELANAILEPGLLGAVQGGVAGGLTRGHAAVKPEDANQAPKVQAISGEQPKPVVADVGNPDSAPARSERVYDKTAPETTQAPQVTEVEAVAPDQAAALAAKQTIPPEVAEAAQRLQQPTPEAPAAPTEELSARSQSDVPPEVTQASQRLQQPAVEAKPGESIAADTNPEVTPQVTPKADVEVPAAPQVKGGRILVAQDDAAKANLKAQREQIAKNVAEAAPKEPTEPKGKKYSKAELAARAEKAQKMEQLFNDLAPTERTAPVTPADRAAAHAELKAIVDEAGKRGIVIPRAAGRAKDASHGMWLADVARIAKKAKPSVDDFTKLYSRENLIRKGASDLVREERIQEGNAVKRADKGNVELAAAPTEEAAPSAVTGEEGEIPSTFRAEQQDMPAAVNTSAKRVTLDDGAEKAVIKDKHGNEVEVDRAVAAAPAKKVEITPELRAKYEQAGVGPKGAEVVEKAKAKAKAKVAPKKAEPKVEPKPEPVTPKVTEPTEAQKEAGNYPKEHVRVHGLEMALENKKGSTRSGVGPDGKEWSVKMPADYGYIKRTEGADGDHVDVYLGSDRDNPRVTVIDQVDPNTRKFDEHKVMMGFRSRDEALKTYDAGFSDGRGMERVGNVRSMSVAEFKDWLKNGDTKKPIAKAEQGKVDALDDTGVVTPKKSVKPLHTTKLHDVLRQLPAGDVTTLGGKMAVFMRKRLLEYAPNVDLHFLTPEDMKAMAGDKAVSERGPMGLHQRDLNDNTLFVAVRDDVANNPELFAHVVLHEATHAATVKAMETHPEFKMLVEHMMDGVERELARRAPETSSWTEAGASPIPKEAAYAMKSAHEFIAEAFSNPRFQELLATIPADEQTARAVGLTEKGKLNAWSLFVASVRHMLRKVLGGPREAYSMLEAIVRGGKDIMEANHPTDKVFDGLTREVTARRRANDNLVDQLADYDQLRDKALNVASDQKLNLQTALRKAGDYASSMWMLADRAKGVSAEFGRLAEKLVSAKAILERAKSHILEKSGGLKIVNDLADLKRENPYEYEAMADIGIEASNLNVQLGKGADNSHLGKDATAGWQAKAKLSSLQARYDMLSPRAQELLKRTAEFYRDQHNAMSRELIKNILHHAGVEEPGLAERIFKDGLTDADKAKFKTDTIVRHLENAADLKEMKGWYVPFRRYGDHIVSGEHDLAAPKGALKVGNDTIQFTDPSDAKARRAAEKFVAEHDLRHLDTKQIWVDKNNPAKILEASDTDAIPAYRVRMQVQHTEFHETPAEARAARARLEGEGLKNVHEATKRDESVRNSSLMSGEMHTIVNSLTQQARFKEMSPTEQAAVKQALMEASVRVMGATKIQSSFLQRRNVGGMSHDLTRITADYSRTAAGYLARLQNQPAVDDAFKALHKHVDDNKFASNKKRMDELVNALTARFKEDEIYRPQTGFAKATRRLLQVSRLDKLAGPSFHIINAQEPWTTSLPVIGGRHGFGRAIKSLGEAYNTIGGRGAVMSGLRDTLAARTRDTGFTDYVDMFKKEIANSKTLGGDKARRLQEMLDYNKARGLFSDEAIFEVGKYADPTANKLLRGLDRADLMSNQMGAAIEGINRAVTAIAAYDLEYKRTGNHEAAMQYSHQVTRDTMGDYATWNQSKAFKHPVGQLALQFKKFAHKTYYLMGKTFRNAVSGDMEAAKQFGGLMVTHMVVAGALGLPLEPFKVALMAANWFGATPYDWSDVEGAVRTLAASLLGVKGGEAFSHGLTRLIGIDTSSRQGLDSLLTFGAPRSQKPNDIKAWLFDTVAGAPVGYLMDQIKSAQALSQGNFAKAAELSIPIKAVADSIKAYEGASAQKSSTNHETMRAMNPFETAAQAAGFVPAAKVENYEKKAYAAGVMQRDKDTRSKLTNAWIAASSVDKSKVWQQVQAFNAGRPQAERLTMSQLTSAASRFKRDQKNYDGGMRFSKRDQSLRQILGIYNTD